MQNARQQRNLPPFRLPAPSLRTGEPEPRHVLKRLRELFPNLHERLSGRLGERMILKIAECIITEPSDD